MQQSLKQASNRTINPAGENQRLLQYKQTQPKQSVARLSRLEVKYAAFSVLTHLVTLRRNDEEAL